MEAPAPSRPAAPAVVAVVVTRNPGPWFEESVRALADQDYPNLAVLYLDAASDEDPATRVQTLNAAAHVERLAGNEGYGWAANHVVELVEGAAFYCFLHDDAAPEPGAIRTLVSEALRSNAGVVGAKLVTFGDHQRLLQVGESVDKTGERSAGVEPGEIDQEQHDAVRDVFVTPSGCILVRADLFAAIGRFDEGIDLLNDDLSLCWRAHVAGARVVVAPDAVVGHVEALGARSDTDRRRERLIRHRLRTVLTCYSGWHLARVLPQAMVVAVLEVIYSVLAGRRGQGRDVVNAWRWNWAHRAEVRDWRRRVAAFRGVPDNEVRNLQIRGSARVRGFLRGTTARGGTRTDQITAVWNRLTAEIRAGQMWWPIAAWAVTALIVLFGSRHLLTRGVPAVGGFPAFDTGPRDLLDLFLSGWRPVGLGGAAPAPTGHGLLAVLAALALGAKGLLRWLLVLGLLPVAYVGAFRLLRPTGSRAAQAAALVVYAAVPVGYDAIAEARWGALVIYASTPWILARLGAAGGWEPFATGPGTGGAGLGVRAVGLGIAIAVVGAFEPAVVVVVALICAGLVAGSLLAGAIRGAGRVAVAGGGAVVVAVALHVPWTLDFVLPGARWEAVVGVPGAEATVGFFEVWRFAVGPVGGSPIALAVPAAALLPLLIGTGWRFAWAVRAWTVAIVCTGTAWAASQGWLPVAAPPAETLLAPAALGLALAGGLGVVAFENDLRAHGFGWRQVASAVAGVLLFVGATPTMLDAGNGRWYLASGGLDATFAFLDREEPGFRVLWMGDPDVLPLPGFALDAPAVDHVVYATSTDGLPGVADSFVSAEPGSTGLIEDAVRASVAGQTSRLGRMLAPMAIRFVVVPHAAAPKPLGGVQRSAPDPLVDALGAQLDLEAVPVNPAYSVFRNRAALPMRSTLSGTTGETTTFELGAGDLAGVSPTLRDSEGTTARGPVTAGSRIALAAGADPGWELLVDGEPAPKRRLFGWAQGFEPLTSGDGVLRYATSPLRYGVLGFQALFWAVAIWFAGPWRRGRGSDR